MLFVSQTPSSGLVYGLGKTGILAKVSIVDAVCNLLLSVALVKPLGLAGVAVGTGIPMIGFSLFLLVFANRLVGGSVLVYLRNVLPIFAICISLQVATWFIAGEIDLGSYAKLAFWLAVLYPPQILVLLFFGFVRPERALIARTCLQAAGLR
jgi:O-antigen/teichoic acid export membrane protein